MKKIFSFKKRYVGLPVALVNETYVQVEEFGQFQLIPHERKMQFDISSGSRSWVERGEGNGIYKTAYGGHLFNNLFSRTGKGGMASLPPVRTAQLTFKSLYHCVKISCEGR